MYKHTQCGWVMIIAAMLIMAADLFLIVLPSSPLVHIGPLVTVDAIIFLSVAIFMLVFFSTLTVKIENGFVKLIFGIGLFRKKILIKDILSSKTARNKWWWGWGIHGTPGKGWLFNVSGLNSVELVMKNGMKYFVGTDEAEKLTQAINNANLEA